MGKIYGYGSISSVKLLRSEPEKLKETKAFKALEQTFHNIPQLESKQFSLDTHLLVDLITATYRKRPKLEYLISNLSFGDTVVITNISALGSNAEEITANYLKIYKANIGLILPDFTTTSNESLSPVSTSGWDFSLPDSLMYKGGELPDSINERLELLKSMDIKTNQGRAFHDRPENFKKVYWLYENYFLQESNLYKNKLISISKTMYRRLAMDYELLDPDYFKDLEEQEKLYKISEKPKRFRAVPDDFQELIDLVESGYSLEISLAQQKYPRLHPIDYKRFKLKHEGGRKAMGQCISAMKNTPEYLKTQENVVIS